MNITFWSYLTSIDKPPRSTVITNRRVGLPYRISFEDVQLGFHVVCFNISNHQEISYITKCGRTFMLYTIHLSLLRVTSTRLGGIGDGGCSRNS